MRKINLILFILFLFNFANAQITGEDIRNDLSLSVTVSEAIPIINIISPKNGTYITNQIDLIFTSKNTDEILFNLDNNFNISTNEPTTFFASTGNHTLNVYAKTENKTTHKSINFTVNPNLFQIIYENYKNYSETTIFEKIIYEEYSNIPDITLKNQFGKINFKENLNLIEDKNITDKTLNLDKYSYINQNELYLNLTELPNFNKTAIIWLYNLQLKNPIILKNGNICPITECEYISYLDNTLVFKVHEPSKFTITEAPTEKIPPTIPQGTVPSLKKSTFTISEEEIKINSEQGRIIEKEIEITNILDTINEIEISFKGLEEIILIRNYTLILNPKETKKIKIEFLIRNYLEPGIQLGELIIDEQIIPITVTIKTRESLFDIKTKIKKKTINPLSKLIFEVELFNLGDSDIIDAELIYNIQDSNKKIIFTETETIEIQKELKKIKEIKLSNKFPEGKYLLTTTINYQNKTAISSDEFQISKIEYYYLIVIFILSLIITIIKIIKDYKSKKSKSRGK